MIRLDKVSKRYRTAAREEYALRDIDLHITEGELCAIVGTSGSGKTTLLNIFGGLDRSYTGTVTVAGNDLHGLSDAALAAFRNRHIGFVFQQFSLLDHLTCEQNVLLPFHFTRAPFAGDPRQRAREALEHVGLGHKVGETPRNLSGGQKQRVAIARALFFKPRILLCDEPTGSLDSTTGQQIIETFRSLNAEGYTVVIITHETRVSSAARRVIRIEDGRIVSDGTEATAGGATA
ncbi:ABC transporter ATP-binding protein [Myxococcota bacterium]|nr:ABC transporter ATP-binding protein [Myxococcota bacterium]